MLMPICRFNGQFYETVNVFLKIICHCYIQMHSQLSADAACFIPSWHWNTTTTTDTAAAAAAVPDRDGVSQPNTSTGQSFPSSQQANHW